MAKLILSLENTVLSEYQINSERVTIGRKPTNDVKIDNLAVSGVHAAVLKIGNDFYVEDQGSTNGTQVNAKLVKSHLLQHGDLIEFGKHQIKYVNEVVSGHAHDSFEKTIMMRPIAIEKTKLENGLHDIENTLVSMDTPLFPVSDPSSSTLDVVVNEVLAPVEAPVIAPVQANPFVPVKASVQSATDDVPAPEVAKLQVLNGASNGRELLLNKALTTLGKPGIQVAVITKRPNGYFITHVEGEVYPLMNGISIGAQAHTLSNHDVIELAGIKMEFCLN